MFAKYYEGNCFDVIENYSRNGSALFVAVEDDTSACRQLKTNKE